MEGLILLLLPSAPFLLPPPLFSSSSPSIISPLFSMEVTAVGGAGVPPAPPLHVSLIIFIVNSHPFASACYFVDFNKHVIVFTAQKLLRK